MTGITYDDHRQPGRAPWAEEAEEAQVGQAGTEQAEPDDREDRLRRPASLRAAAREEGQDQRDDAANVTWNTAGTIGRRPWMLRLA